MRTSLELPDHIFREVKALAARLGVPLKAVLQAAIENELSRQAGVEQRVSGPLVRCKGKKPIRLTNTEIEDILA
jgi:hypothetical protein